MTAKIDQCTVMERATIDTGLAPHLLRTGLLVRCMIHAVQEVHILLFLVGTGMCIASLLPT
jgi:hypothetical protein